MAVGGRELHELARRCKQLNDKKLTARLRKGLIDATKGTDSAVREAFAQAMPQRGGYAATLAADMRTRTSVRLAGADARVQIVVWADGTRERRDLPALNRGRLRHPVYGRSRPLANGRRRKNPWATTKVPDRSFDHAVDRTADKVAEQMQAVHDEIAAIVMGR
jgi:hypothetical protein